MCTKLILILLAGEKSELATFTEKHARPGTIRIPIDKLRLASQHQPSLSVRDVDPEHAESLRLSMAKNNVNQSSTLSAVVIVT
jgi:hypothetical protein